MALWKQIDPIGRPRYLDEKDVCYFAREYIAGGGWQASRANQLIVNFKKPPEKKDTSEWTWKVRAATQFAQELAEFVPEHCCIVTIPTSKPYGHALYDERFLFMLAELHRLRPDLQMEEPIVRLAPCLSQHAGGTRTVAEARKTLGWAGFEKVPRSSVFLIDDVITWGTNFKACQQLLWQHQPQIPVGGVFWARTVWP